MKNRKIISVIGIMAISAICCACGDSADDQQATVATQAVTVKQTTTPTQVATQTTAPTQAPTQAPTEAPTEAPTQAPEPIPAPVPTPQPVARKTANGYDITVVDGITYVDGVMIANKTYSLPEDYYPGDLTPETWNAFYNLQAGAASDGLNIYSSSPFRSYATQAYLYQSYCNRDGKAAADTYSARPGHSEHQTGLALDVNIIDDSFIGTPEAIWLANNSYKYGFIIRYPQGKQDITGYKYEPWHLRYLGVDLATKIFNSGLTMEEYYGIDSVYQD